MSGAAIRCASCPADLPAGRKLRVCRDCQRQRDTDRWARPGRKCSRCGDPLPEGRRSTRCLSCKRTMAAALRRKPGRLCPCGSPVSIRSDYCSGCLSDRYASWRDADPENARAVRRRWCQDNPEKVRLSRRLREERKRSGKVTKADRAAVIAAAGGKCQRCGVQVPEGAGHLDHIVPLARGGAHEPANLQFLCAPCNLYKADRLDGELHAGAGQAA